MDVDELKKLRDESAKAAKALAREIRAIAAPVDVNELERTGVLTKEGKWWRVNQPASMPKGLEGLIDKMMTKGDVLYVTLRKTNRFASKVKRLNKLGL